MGAFFSKMMGERFSCMRADDADGVPPKYEVEWTYQYDVLKLIVENPPQCPTDNWQFAAVLRTAIALCPELVRVEGHDQNYDEGELYPVALAAVKWFEAHHTPYVLERRDGVLLQVDAKACPSGPAPSETNTVV